MFPLKCLYLIANGLTLTLVQKPMLGFTRVDIRKATYKNEPFIMETQAKHVFYVIYPSNTRCSIVLQGKYIPDCH